jgi:hypothetical protein
MKMPFGKHTGKEISELPDSYLEWLVSGNSRIPRPIIEEVQQVIKARKDSAVPPVADDSPAGGPQMISAPRTSDEFAEVSKKDEHKARFFDGEVRDPMILGTFLAKIDGTTVRYTEIRSLRPIRSDKPVMKGPYMLTHVLTVKDGALGYGPKASTQIWLVREEAEALEEKILGNSAKSVAIPEKPRDNNS